MDNPAAPITSISLQPAVQPEFFSPVEPSNRRWLLWLAGGLFMLIIGIAIGVFGVKFFSESQNQSQLTSTPSPTLSPTPTPTPDPTADWKTYSNNTYRFSFKYPIEWQLACTEPQNNDWLDATICQLTAPNTQLDHGYLSSGAYLAVGISKPNPNYSNLKDYIAFSVNQHGYKSSPKTINTIEGYLLSPPESPKTYSNFVFESKGYIIHINWIPTDENNPNYPTINQILSTFKFLD